MCTEVDFPLSESNCMDTLRSREVAVFSETLERLYQPVSLDDFPTHLFSVIASLIPGAMMSFDEISKRTGALRHSRNFELRNPAEWMQRLSVNLQREHPGVKYVHSGGLEQVLYLGDFLSRRQLRQTALYHENYKEPGIASQVAVVLPVSGSVAGVAINRDTGFRDGEIALIRLLHPHLVQAYSNARLFSALHRKGAAPWPASHPANPLRPREIEVLGWLAQGKRDREISTILGISHRTVHKHVEHILEKLGVETRSAAAAWASARMP